MPPTRYLTEIVGLAGSGKSTLDQILRAKPARFVESEQIRLKQGRQIPFFLVHALTLLPRVGPLVAGDSTFDWVMFKRILYLHAWERRLGLQARRSADPLLIDQGPIFEMATVRAFAPANLRTETWKPWWEDCYQRWGRALKRIIWLEAPVDILLDRIRSRRQFHPIQHWDDGRARDYLATYTRAYIEVINELTARYPIPVDRFDSSRLPADEIGTRVMARKMPAVEA